MNTKKIGLLCGSFALIAASAAWAAPKDVYVTVTGAGDMDGRDWDHAMFSITEAYALCAANAEGGTVHVAGGIYRSTGWDAEKGNFTQNAAIVPASNVTLLGCGDKDNPTILTGDCGLDNVWTTGTIPQWQNGKLVEPAEDAYTCSTPSGQVNDTLFCDSSAAIENCRFENLTFHGFIGKDWNHWISNVDNAAIKLSNAANVVFDSCRFVGMDLGLGQQLGVAALSLSDSSATITNCSFVANRTGLQIIAATETPVRISGCLFRAGRMSGTRSDCCAIKLANNVCAVIENTMFRYNYSMATCDLDASTLKQSVTIRNTVFEHCICDQVQAGKTICSVGKGGTFDGCLFVSNAVNGAAGGAYYSAAIVADGNCRVQNCYIGYNSLTKTASALVDASFFASNRNFGHTFVNCTVESNRVEGSDTACTIGAYALCWLSVANCVFRNNDFVDKNGVRQREFRNVSLEEQTYYPPLFVNTIIWNDAADYVPFAFKAGDNVQQRMGVASCDIKNYTPAASTTGMGFFYQPIVDEEPKFADKTVSDGPRRACPLTVQNSSDIRSKAVKVCRADTGDFYFLDKTKSPNQWRKIDAMDNTKAELSQLSLAQGEAIGLTPDMAAYADVFGAPRRAKASMGPVDAPPLGMKVIVR